MLRESRGGRDSPSRSQFCQLYLIAGLFILSAFVPVNGALGVSDPGPSPLFDQSLQSSIEKFGQTDGAGTAQPAAGQKGARLAVSPADTDSLPTLQGYPTCHTATCPDVAS